LDRRFTGIVAHAGLVLHMADDCVLHNFVDDVDGLKSYKPPSRKRLANSLLTPATRR
jgi:hypothetical protein